MLQPTETSIPLGFLNHLSVAGSHANLPLL